MRVHELAKELNIPSKELVEQVNEKLKLGLKSHSSTISDAQADKIKALYNRSANKPSVKPKAFIVKKQKPAEAPEEKVEEEVKKPVMKTVSKLEVVRSAPKPEAKTAKPNP